ncbi:MAG: hypothetical protein APR54_00470 [Candidatus Cloacimonas sp. SDB]|nr:MAG: hypothetical protein APR54_00470 [Candidatus Cloacimonas sp. SDB]
MRRIFMTGMSLILLFLMISCTIKDFEAPEFDTKITLPLLNEKYYMADIADTTNDYVIYVENDTLLFSISEDFETEYVGEDDLMIEGKTEEFDADLSDELMIDSREESTVVEVGDDLSIAERNTIIERYMNRIEVEESGNAYANIVILEFASAAIEEPVEPIYGEIIPPFYDFEAFNQDFTLFENENFEYVVIDTGSVHITFFNNTELPLSSDLGPDYQMHFEFYTNGSAAADDGTYLFTHYIENVIEPGETIDISIPFDGNTVYMTNYLKCFLTTDGSGDPIDVLEDDSFEVSYAIGNMTILEANAVIESASVNNENGISLIDDEIQITYAIIDSCIGNIILENNLPFLIDTLRLNFHELYSPQEDNLIILENGIMPGETREIPLDLQNYFIESNSGNPLDSLSFNLYAVTDPPDGYSLVNQNDMVFLDITLGEMLLNQFTGFINQISEESNTIDIAEDDFEIQSALIGEGHLEFVFWGIDLQEASSITILFDEIFDPELNEQLEIIITDFDDYQFDLTGCTINLTEDQILNYHTAVHLDQSITLTNSDIVTAEITLSELYFDYVTGRFGSFEIEEDNSTEIDSTGEFNLFYAEINNCDLQINITEENYPLPFGATIELKFPDVYDNNNQPLEFNFTCPGDTLIDLSGFKLGNDADSQTIIDSLIYSYTIITDDSSDEILTLYADQTVEASILISDIVFDLIVGILDNKSVELEDITKDIDLSDLPDSLAGLLEFQIVEMHLNIMNQTGFDCRLMMNIAASNDEAETVEITIDETIFAETETEIVITDNISEMLNLFPTEINITNITAYIGDGITPGSITLNDSISGGYEVVSPMQFIINDHLLTDTADAVELDDDDQDTIEDNLSSVKFTIEAVNKLPIGAELTIYFANDSTLVFENPGLIIDSLYVLPASIGDGLTGEPSQNQFIIELTENDFEVFLDRENQNVYPGIELQILGTDGDVVTILGNDNIHIVGYLETVVHIIDQED